MTTDHHEDDEEEKDLKILEYQCLLAGYHSRDESIPRRFHEMMQVFGAYSTLLVGIVVDNQYNFIQSSQFFLTIIWVYISVSGVLALLAFLINLQSLSSSKNALRERCTLLENEFNASSPQYWKSIDQRRKFIFESRLKPSLWKWNPPKSWDVHELRVGGVGYLMAAQTIFYLWIIFMLSAWATKIGI